MILTAGATEIVRRRLDTTSQRAIARTLKAAYALMVAGLMVFALGESFWLALAGLLLFEMLRGTADPIFSTWTNQHIDSNVRATMLSSFGQVNAIGQIGGGPVVGAIGEQIGLRAALGASGVLLSPVVWLIARASRRQAAADFDAGAFAAEIEVSASDA
jgi:DHA3 family tetracycline resistance protein-like MFS transporter